MKPFGLAAVMVFASIQVSSADEAGALVIDVVGEVSPIVEAFEDVPIGHKFLLGTGSELTISHYKACEEVTFRGGEVSVLADALTSAGSEVVDRVQVDCPEAVALAAADTASATVVVRNFAELPKIPLSPSIVLVGGRADEFRSMAIHRDGVKIADVEIRNRQVVWPDTGLYLSDRTKYGLTLAGDQGTFETEIVADRRSSARLVLKP